MQNKYNKHMIKNIGKTDRLIRLFVGAVAFLLIGVFRNVAVQWVLFIISIIALFTSLIGWCGVYKLFKINTCKTHKK